MFTIEQFKLNTYYIDIITIVIGVFMNLLASLQSKIESLESELHYLNKILIEYGFPEGIKTLKDAVEEVLVLN